MPSTQLPKAWAWVYKWEADNDFIAADYYYYASENIDTLSNPKYYKLSAKPVTVYDKTADANWDWSLTIFSKYAKIINISNNNWSWDAYVYNNGVYATSIHNVATIYKAIEFQNKIFFAYLRSGYEFAVPYTIHYGYMEIDSTTWNIMSVYNPVEWRVTDFWTYNVELYNFNDALLVFAVWYKIRAVQRPLLVNPTGWIYPCDTVTPTLSLRRRDNVVWIVQYMEQFKIYTTYGDRDNPQTSCAYICNQADIEAGTFTQKIDYPSINIKAVISNWSIDYAICSDGDYLLSGWQNPKKISSKPSYTDFRRANTTFYWSNYVTTNIDWDYNVRVYGKEVAWFPDQITNYVEFTNIKSMTSWNGKIIVSGTYNWIKWVFYVQYDPTDVLEKVDTWSLTYMKFYWNLASTLKTMDQFTLGHKLPVWTSIAMQVSLDEGPFTTIKTFSWADYEWKTRSFLFADQMALTSKEWWWMQLKIVLTSSSDNRVLTPWIMDILMLYSDIIKWR